MNENMPMFLSIRRDVFFMLSGNCLLTASQIEEEHTDKHQYQIDNLTLQVLFMEQHGPEQERYDDTAAAYH